MRDTTKKHPALCDTLRYGTNDHTAWSIQFFLYNSEMRHLLNRNLQLLFVIFCTKLLLTGSVQGAGSLAGEKAAPNPQRHQVQQASPLQGKVAQLIAETRPNKKY